MHDKHELDGVNCDLINFTREDYLNMTKNFTSSFPAPVVKQIHGFNVVDESQLGVGSKSRFGELLISSVNNEEIVYVQPRYGFAGVSLTRLCNLYNKKLTLFMPACKQISDHQAYCIERGCKPMFHRIAAMPNLNRLAKQYADEVGAFFVPFGLKHPLVTAMIVKTCEELRSTHGDIRGAIWCAISTGVLARGLQIGFPNSRMVAVAVARNLKAGEVGTAEVLSYHRRFDQPADVVTDLFDSASNYDAKAFDYMLEKANTGDWFWNVAGNIKSHLDKSTVNSYKEWGEK